jgi:hypothetical protein
MKKYLRFSVRDLALLTVIAGLAAALYRTTTVESDPVYLHVYGSMVDSTHDDERPADSPLSPDGPAWTRIATVRIYDGRPFGFFTPNNREPSIGGDGKLRRGFDGKYRGSVHFWLDDSNLTYDFTQTVQLTLENVETIDAHYDCYLLSAEKNPYWALSAAIEPEGLSRNAANQAINPSREVGRLGN